MVMWITSRGRLFASKYLRSVMSSKRSTRKIEENAAHSSQSTNHQRAHNQLNGHDVPVLQHQQHYQESRRHALSLRSHNALLSPFRLNQVQLPPASAPTSRLACPLYSTFTPINDQTPVQTSAAQKTQNLIKKNVKQDTTQLRQWRKLEERSPARSFPFKVMSYNVLAQILMERHPELYSRDTHKDRYLKWSYRWEMLQHEFQLHMADVICLQEVQESHFGEFQKFFKRLGYEGIFKQRTGTEYPDGCAIFYKTQLLQLVEYNMVEYYQPGTTFLNRNNVGIVARLKPVNVDRSFVVATTHLLFNPKREDVRLAQTQMMLTELGRFAFDNKLKENVPIILCGDFNSEINATQNGVYQLITRRRIDYTNIYPNRRVDKTWIPANLGITNGCQYLPTPQDSANLLAEANRRNIFESGELSHNFNFTSVYGGDAAGVSTHQNRWIQVDYLFYTTANRSTTGELRCVQRFDLPTAGALQRKRIRGIPNCRLGSDHFSLLAQFEFRY